MSLLVYALAGLSANSLTIGGLSGTVSVRILGKNGKSHLVLLPSIQVLAMTLGRQSLTPCTNILFLLGIHTIILQQWYLYKLYFLATFNMGHTLMPFL